MSVESDAMLSIVPGPFWANECNHTEGTYVASFALYDHQAKMEDVFDIYVFEGTLRRGHTFCLRYGNLPSEYQSPGGIVSLTRGAAVGMESYARALRILEVKGQFLWQRKA